MIRRAARAGSGGPPAGAPPAIRAGRRGAAAAIAVLALLAAGAHEPAASRSRAPRGPGADRREAARPRAAEWGALVGGLGPESAPARQIDGAAHVGANDLARLLQATKFWRADVRKLVLRARGHRIQLTADNPFVLVDDATVRLPVAVRSRGGELQVPVALVDLLPRDTTIARLIYDPVRSVILQVPPSGLVGVPRITVEGGETRVTFPVDRPEEVLVASRSRAHFRVHFSGFFVGAPPRETPQAGLVRAVRPIPTAVGCAFELVVSPRAEGFRLVRESSANRVALVYSTRARAGLEAFAPEGPAGPPPVRTVVLDPGHGGADAGVSVAGAVEKDLTLDLARRLKAEIERRVGARVVLTRDDDRDLTVEQRAQRANLAHADLVLSLHFDGFTDPAVRGATAYCPPATFGSAGGPDPSGVDGSMAVLPWRDVATRHAVRSRALADDVLWSLELRAHTPTRLREILPYSLLGVNAPGLMLECATLTSEADRTRVRQPQGMADLAAAIVDGIEAYQKSP